MLTGMQNPHAVSLGRLGGKARARALPPKRRRQIAKQAATSRWDLDRQRRAFRWDEIRDRVYQDRPYRHNLACQISSQTQIDPGDLEHVLFNLSLPSAERLARCLAPRSPR